MYETNRVRENEDKILREEELPFETEKATIDREELMNLLEEETQKPRGWWKNRVFVGASYLATASYRILRKATLDQKIEIWRDGEWEEAEFGDGSIPRAYVPLIEKIRQPFEERIRQAYEERKEKQKTKLESSPHSNIANIER